MRKIIHIDMDCFYAAVEIRDDPSLKGRPVAVGGHSSGRGVLTTANYEARKYGLHSAMPTSTALRLCPDLVLVPVHFDKYRTVSNVIKNIFQRFTSLVQPLSLDEAYLDVSDSILFEGSATKIAKEIRRIIYKETGLTASAGIAPNKFLAKVASDWNKPDGQFTVSPQIVDQFVSQLKIEKIPGVGNKTAEKMYKLKIKTCTDLQKWSIEKLNDHFGVWGLQLYDLCRGVDDREVKLEGVRKSLSVERTFSEDLQTEEDCLDKIPKIYNEFCSRLEKTDLNSQISSLVVKIKFHDFKQTTLERAKVKVPSLELYNEMIKSAFAREGKPVRLLGLGVKFHCKKVKVKSLQQELF